VGDDQNRAAAAHQAFEELEDRLGGPRVEVAGRLVRDQERWVVRHGARDRGALLLPARHGRGQLAGVLEHPDLFEEELGAGAALAGRVQAAEVHRQHDVLDQRERRQELEELEDDPDVAAAPLGQLRLAERVHRRLADGHAAGGRPVDARDHVQQRGLSAARFPHQRNKFAAINGQVNAFEDGHFTCRVLEDFDDTVHINHCLGCGHGVFRGINCRLRKKRVHLPLPCPIH
jgi:hypothetical protein